MPMHEARPNLVPLKCIDDAWELELYHFLISAWHRLLPYIGTLPKRPGYLHYLISYMFIMSESLSCMHSQPQDSVTGMSPFLKPYEVLS